MNSRFDQDVLFEVLRRRPVLDALRDGALDRGDLEAALGISRATSHRITRSLLDLGLVERVDGRFELTEVGRALGDAADEFAGVTAAGVHLAPAVDALRHRDDVPAIPLPAFADAVVTTPSVGDPHAPAVRFLELLAASDSLRGFDTWSVVPTYMAEFQQAIVDGTETELIDPVDVVEAVMADYPERCVEVCVSGHLTIRLHDDLPFGLAIFDDHVGVCVRDGSGNGDGTGPGGLTAFVDTDDPAVRAWAETVFDAYREESVVLEQFTRTGLAAALAGH